MTTKLQTMIEATQELSPLEQLNLIRVISHSLYRSYHPAVGPEGDFWQPRTLEQFVQTQQIEPLTDIASLRVDFWPESESVDDFIEYVYQQRQEDRSN